MNTLQKIWKIQKSFQHNFFDPDNLTRDEKIKLSKEFILCLHRELGEVLNILPWKLHRRVKRVYNTARVKEELIDCFKFLINLCMVHGMTPDSFEKLFIEKSKIVEARYKKEKKHVKALLRSR